MIYKNLKRTLVLGASLCVLWACNREYFDFENFQSDSVTPTYAVPIADLNLKLEDILQRYADDIDQIYADEYSSGTDSVFYLQIVYEDTIGTFDFEDITGQSTNQAVPTSALPLPFSMGKDSIELNIFGQLGSADALFRLTNPRVGFVFDNQMNNDYAISFDNLYTRNIQTNAIYDFEVISSATPFDVLKNNSTEIVLSNDNTQSTNGGANPMTNVIEPTPKFVYYEPLLDVINSDSLYPGGDMTVVSQVYLPLEGYAKFTYRDTLPLQNLGVDDATADLVDEVTLRIISTNGLPLDVLLTAEVYDSVSQNVLYTLPLLDEDGNAKPNSIFLTSPEVDASDNNRPVEPYKEITDITISNEDFKKVVKGTSVIIKAEMFSTDFDTTNPDHINSATVKMYTDYVLGVGIGLKSRLNINPVELGSEE